MDWLIAPDTYDYRAADCLDYCAVDYDLASSAPFTLALPQLTMTGVVILKGSVENLRESVVIWNPKQSSCFS